MGHSPGIGYPSSCFIPNDLQQTTVHSYSGGFIGLPTQLIVARVCSCQPTMLKKFDYVVMMTGSKASEPITTFLVLGGLTTPSQFFCVFKCFLFVFFWGGGSIALLLLHQVLDFLIAARKPFPLHDLLKILVVLEQLPYGFLIWAGLVLLQIATDGGRICRRPGLPARVSGSRLIQGAKPVANS